MQAGDGSAPPQRFSLASIVRFTTLVSLVFGWVSLVNAAPPHVARNVVLIGTVFLAVIIGWRRRGSPFERLEAGVTFFIGGEIVGMITWVLGMARERDERTFGWAFYLPVVVVLLLFMLRAWVTAVKQSQAAALKGP